MKKDEENDIRRIAIALERIAKSSEQTVNCLDSIYGRLDEIRMELIGVGHTSTTEDTET